MNCNLWRSRDRILLSRLVFVLVGRILCPALAV